MNKVFFAHIDWHLLIPSFVLVFIGLATLFSVNGDFFRNQLIYFLFSFALFVFFTNVDYAVFQFYAFPIYVVSLIFLLFVLLLGIESRGAVRWVEIFGVSVQFSEILKPFLTLAFAAVLLKTDRSSFRSFLTLLAIILPIPFLIIIQPDLGSGIIYLGVVLCTLIAFGFPWRWFLAGFAAFAISTPFLWHFLRDYQKKRVLTFINPTSDPLGISYNAIQSMIAVGSGGIFGKGAGEGTQSTLRFLPERHTDFIFATLSENLGLVGILVVFISFAFLLYRIYTIYTNTEEPYYKILCICAFFLFLIQFFMNAGMNMGMVPVVGVTLPFVSYGGSSLLSNFILLGFLSSISKNYGRHHALEIR
jgi:rod shape determining protein RodA